MPLAHVAGAPRQGKGSLFLEELWSDAFRLRFAAPFLKGAGLEDFATALGRGERAAFLAALRTTLSLRGRALCEEAFVSR